MVAFVNFLINESWVELVSRQSSNFEFGIYVGLRVEATAQDRDAKSRSSTCFIWECKCHNRV